MSASTLLPGWVAPATVTKLEEAGTTACRLATAPDGWVERLGQDVLISYTHDAAREQLRDELRAWSGRSWHRVFAKHLPKQNADRVSPVLLEGPAEEPPLGETQEAGTRYGLDFSAGYSNGFFIDQRANRARVREFRPKRLLNTFAYTCSFSVVAAEVGASTVSVDLSRKSLDRGRTNFELNGLTTDAHSFLADDVLQVLPRLIRRGEKFDCIILDPPTFSRGHGGRRFQAEEHLADLLAVGLELAGPKAKVLLSTNFTRIKRAQLLEMARFGLKLARRSGQVEPGTPLPDFPGGAGAQTVWLLLQ